MNTPREADNLTNQGGHSPDLLADQSLDDLEVPPELPSQWAPVIGAPETPLRGLAIGELHSPSPANCLAARQLKPTVTPSSVVLPRATPCQKLSHRTAKPHLADAPVCHAVIPGAVRQAILPVLSDYIRA